MDQPGNAVAPKRQRLFFALWPDDATRAGLDGWTRALHRAGGGRMTRAQNVHLTLAFLGGTDSERLPAIEAAASRVAPRAFTLRVDEPGYWRHNRIAWAGVRSVPAALDDLVAELRAALVAAEIAFDAKPFVPHITLVRQARPGFRLPALEPIDWPVTGFVLVRSATGPNGSEYVVHGRWP